MSAFVRTFSRRNPSAHSRIAEKSSLSCGGTSGTEPTITSPVPPLIVIVSPSCSSWPGQPRRLRLHVDVQRLAAGHARRSHPARDDRRMRGEAAVGGQDPLRLHHPVEVVRGRLPADEDHALPRLAALLGRVGVEDDRAGRGARRGVQPLRDDRHLGGRVDHRMEELVELRRVDPGDRLLLRDQPLLDHLDRRAQRRRGRPLRRARLEEVERRSPRP